jgi:hypothetical protein
MCPTTFGAVFLTWAKLRYSAFLRDRQLPGVRPGLVTWVLMPRICLWEWLEVFAEISGLRFDA